MRARVLSSLVALVACVAPRAPATSPPLSATLTVLTPRVRALPELRVRVKLANTGTAPRRVLMTYVGSGSLALDLRDASDARVPPLPPPTPGAAESWRTLSPGESIDLDYGAFVAVDGAPGKYRVRFTGVPADPANAIASPWQELEVAR